MEPQVLAGAQALIDRCRPLLYVENNEPGASKRLSEDTGQARLCRVVVDLFLDFDQRNFYSNPVNVWENVVPAANLLCAAKEANLSLGGHRALPRGGGTTGDPACSA